MITCLPSPAISEAVLREILQKLKPGSSWIEMSTLGRDAVERLASIAADNGVRMLECPVTGGVHLAAGGRITVLAGGDADLFEEHRPALAAMGGSSSIWGLWARPRSSRSSPTCWPSSISWPMAKR